MNENAFARKDAKRQKCMSELDQLDQLVAHTESSKCALSCSELDSAFLQVKVIGDTSFVQRVEWPDNGMYSSTFPAWFRDMFPGETLVGKVLDTHEGRRVLIGWAYNNRGWDLVTIPEHVYKWPLIKSPDDTSIRHFWMIYPFNELEHETGSVDHMQAIRKQRVEFFMASHGLLDAYTQCGGRFRLHKQLSCELIAVQPTRERVNLKSCQVRCGKNKLIWCVPKEVVNAVNAAANQSVCDRAMKTFVMCCKKQQQLRQLPNEVQLCIMEKLVDSCELNLTGAGPFAEKRLDHYPACPTT